MATQASHFEYDGFATVSDKLDAIKVTTPEFKKKVREAVWEVLYDVRRTAAQNANFKDSRHNSIAAIRRTVYKKIMGGAVSILDKKTRKSKGGTGQSGRTQQINSYAGKDRGFILRFVNSGTVERYASEGRNTNMSREYIRSKRGKPGYRGSVKGSNFFAPAANGAIQTAAEKLADIIEQEINAQFNK